MLGTKANLLAADTIVARSTPEGLGAVAVLRISGPLAGEILEKVFRPTRRRPVQTPRTLVRGAILDADGRPLDDVLVAYFPGPNSYTGESLAEVHCHGGEVVVSCVIDAILQAGARPAVRGEFTRRAFENGKLDLTRAEAINQLIQAGTREQVLGARRVLGGELERHIRQIQGILTETLVNLEAGLDFPEEQETKSVIVQRVDIAAEKIQQLRNHVCMQIPGEIEIVFGGKPNVGKSSIVNELIGRQVSIVTDIPGTTRDAVSTSILLGGRRVLLVDTAGQGMETPAGRLEQEARKVAERKLKEADLVVWVTDARNRPEEPPAGTESLWVANKVDLLEPAMAEASLRSIRDRGGLPVSALTGVGLQELQARLEGRTQEIAGPADGIPVSNRQQQAVDRICRGIEQANRALEASGPELAVADLREALTGTEELLGERVEPDILDAIFEQFCIGK